MLFVHFAAKFWHGHCMNVFTNIDIWKLNYFVLFLSQNQSSLKFEIMVEFLTAETFKEKVFDYANNKEWKFSGDKPCLIVFYADWCGPCKMVAPILDELSEEYKGKVDVFKIDTEKEQELAAVFGIQSIPSLLFVPMEGQPQMAMGALPKETFEKAISDVLKVEK